MSIAVIGPVPLLGSNSFILVNLIKTRLSRRVGLDGKTGKLPAFKPKIEVASPVTTDDLAEAELSVMQRQKV
jgi:hypothetical protein